MSQVVDAVGNLFTPDVVSTRPSWSQRHMRTRFAVGEDILSGIPLEAQLEEMDRAGIDRAILVVPRMGPPGSPGHWAMDPAPVIQAIERHPHRFAGQIGIDPTGGVCEIQQVRSMVNDHGFVGAHFYPHWFDMPPDAPLAYPFYEACEELGIPIQIQIGQAMVYSPDRPLRSVGQPMSLEPIALDFPDLTVIGSHLGFPWVDEAIALAALYPNVYVCTDSYAPKHWPASMDAFVAGSGVGKVIFGTMWPTIPMARAVEEIKQKELPAAALDALLGGAATAVYGLD